MILKQSHHTGCTFPHTGPLARSLCAAFCDNRCAVNRSAWLEVEAPPPPKKKEAFDETTAAVLECRAEREGRQREHRCLWVLSTWIWWVCLCFALAEQTVQRLSDKMGSIWAYLLGRWTALSHFKMPRPDGVLFSLAPPFSPPPPLLQTNQYPHSLAFHRKDYREMAIKGLASITSLISKPLKDSGSRGLGSGTRCPITLQG